MMPAHPFLRSFALVLVLVGLVHAAVAALYLARPELFYYRAWEYFFMWANTTVEDDSRWQGTEYSDLGHLYFFKYQESRDTTASTDADGFRAVPSDLGPPRIFIQGRSNVFGSGVSDDQTYAWQLATQAGTATFNGAHGDLLSTLSRPGLEQVEVVIDIYHERHLAKLPLARRMFALKHANLQPYKAIGQQNMTALESMRRPIVRPGWWLPDIIARQWRRLLMDFKEHRIHGTRPYLHLAYGTDGSPLEDVIALMERRRQVVESLGYRYLAMIIPSRQTIFRPGNAPTEALVRGTRIAELLEERDFPLVNLYPAFRSGTASELYFHYDTHWSPRGQALAAELTRAELERRWPELVANDSAQAEPSQ